MTVSAQPTTRVITYGVGLTDVVKERAESSDARLGAADFDVPGFIAKIDTFRPRVVAFNGEKAAKVVGRHLGERVPAVEPASWTVADSFVYRLPSSSAAAAIGTVAKREAWAEFGRWVRGSPCRFRGCAAGASAQPRWREASAAAASIRTERRRR